MFTQLFGHFLLNKGIVNAEQLGAALEAKNDTRAKLGALAIDAGYMTAEQVEQVHEEQRRVDKRIGDIAVEMGFLTNEQVDELLSKQKTANIVIGQALIDLGHLTNQQFADALAEYKKSSTFTEGEQTDEALSKQLISMFGFDSLADKDFYAEYILLLVRNIIRFIGDDFVFSVCNKRGEVKFPCISSQNVEGAISAYTAIAGDEKAFVAIASRYAGEEITSADEFAEACVGEFLNLQNGLYAVNISNARSIELDLTPQTAEKNVSVSIDGGICVNLAFSFGNVGIIVIKK